MATTHVIASTPGAHLSGGGSHSSSSSNIVGVHYKVGKKIGEGSFGVIFEGEYDLPHSTLLQASPSLPTVPENNCQAGARDARLVPSVLALPLKPP